MRNFLFCLTLLLFLGLPFTQEGIAKEYEIPTIKVEAIIRSDGSVRIIEHRTYRFEGSFSWADYRLPFEGFKAIKDIRVSEQNSPFQHNNSEEAGTFLVQRNEDHIRIQWFYNAEDEQRTFTISYTLEGAIVHGPAWSEFFWNYISSDRDKDTDQFQVMLTLPRAVNNDSLYSWKRGPLSKLTLSNMVDGYTATASNVDDDEFVKIRTVFPRSVFTVDAISTNDPDFSLAQARADEEAHKKTVIAEQKRDARLADYGQQFIIIASLLSILAFVFFYRKYGKRHTVSTVSATETIMIPGRLKPAVAGWLLTKRNIGSAHLMATLLDLARKKYFIIKEQEPKKRWLASDKKIFTIEKPDSQPQGELSKWEADLADFISTEIKKGNNRIDKLFSESSYKASKWFSSWKNKVDKECKSFGWYDKHSYTGVYWNSAVQSFLLIGSLTATIWAGPIGIIGILITTIFLIGSMGIIRRTPEGERKHKRWQAYKDGLKNAENYNIEQTTLDKHFIYSVAFGLSKNDIQAVFKQSDMSNIAFYWFVFHGNSIQSASEIASTFSTLGATGTSSFPGASAGAGAGASAGAAGGGAAGGAG